MKKIICLVLVLAFCMALACPVFAAEENDDFVSSPGTTPACDHSNTELIGSREPSCSRPGYTGDTVCADCGEVLEEGETIAKLDHEYKDGRCIHCHVAEDNPQTGDNSLVFVWVGVMVAAAAGLVTLTTVYRKKFANQ